MTIEQVFNSERTTSEKGHFPLPGQSRNALGHHRPHRLEEQAHRDLDRLRQVAGASLSRRPSTVVDLIRWVHEKPSDLCIDPDRIAIGGDAQAAWQRRTIGRPVAHLSCL